MEKEIIMFLEDIPLSWRSRRLTDRKEYIEYLNFKYPSYDLKYQIQFLLKGLSSEPTCIVCNNVLNLPDKKTCSGKCREIYKTESGNRTLIQAKAKETCIKKYGVDNAAKLESTQVKRVATNIKKYGAKISSATLEKSIARVPLMLHKGRETLQEKYGIDNPGQMPNHREKCKKTILKNYGVESYKKSEEYVVIRDKNRLLKWDKFSSNSVTIISITDPLGKVNLFNNPNSVINFKCKVCERTGSLPTETFKWRINNTGTPCIVCSGIHGGSIKENSIATYIESLGVKVERNNRILLDGKELDIFLEEYNLAIEFCGLYWHNDLRTDNNYHLNKLKLCQNKGIQLITMFEDEWDHNQEIVKNRIRNALGKNGIKVGARQTTVKEIPASVAKEFLNKFHIQGYAQSSIKIGLYHNNDLVSVMTFSKLTRAKSYNSAEGHWEISRFASKFDLILHGAASKMFSYFLKQHDPKFVLSFADLRWGTGNVYEKLGFVRKDDTRINYWYILGSRRIYRYALRKNINDNPNLTEYENRLEQGYLRIWDCGNSKWIWENI